jgi:hypothetical protein
MEKRRHFNLLENPGTFKDADHLSCAEVETSEVSLVLVQQRHPLKKIRLLAQVDSTKEG